MNTKKLTNTLSVVYVFASFSLFPCALKAGEVPSVCIIDPCASGCPEADSWCCLVGGPCCLSGPDCNENSVPDPCEAFLYDVYNAFDTDHNDILDECEWIVDLDVDSDNNNGASDPDRNAYEDSIEDGADPSWVFGKLVAPNVNDDDGDGVPDYQDTDGVIGEINLVPMILHMDGVVTNIPSNEIDCWFTLNPPGLFNIWLSPNRDEPTDDWGEPTPIPVNGEPVSFLLESVNDEYQPVVLWVECVEDNFDRTRTTASITVVIDANRNGEKDAIEIRDFTDTIIVSQMFLSEVDADCNGNAIPDVTDILVGTSEDDNYNGIPDECEGTWWVDLDIDSDNNSENLLPDRSREEDGLENVEGEPGKLIYVNDDDDNVNLSLDLNEMGIVYGEDELVPIVIDIQTQLDIEPRFTLTFPEDSFRIWKSPYRGDLSESSEDYMQRYTSYAFDKVYMGDVNGDDAIDQSDTVALNSIIACLDAAGENCIPDNYPNPYQVADYDHDHILDATDELALVQQIGTGEVRYAPLVLWVEWIDAWSLSYDLPETIKLTVDIDEDNGSDEITDTVQLNGWWEVGYCHLCETNYNGQSSCSTHNGVEPWEECEGLFEFPYTDAVFSQCYGEGAGEENGYNTEWQDYSFHTDMKYSLGPGDFPPISVDPDQNTLPLVAKQGMYFDSPNPYRERPMLNNTLDIITGRPLLREVDFELPFGGAVYRHVRTYGEIPALIDQAWDSSGLGYRWGADGAFNDWNGTFWMMGEAPILLFDARFDKLIYPNNRRCYLMLDAHHSIPFEFDENQGQYIAPAWFDAVLQHDGVPEDEASRASDSDGWLTRPTTIKIWLNRNSVCYTFKIIWQDLWNWQDNDGVSWSAHDAVTSSTVYPFTGFPYYALVDSITDRYGNRMEYEYCKFGRVNYEPDDDESSSFSCNLCHQNCNEKGQIKSIKLIDANDVIQYTLAYCHRQDFMPDFGAEYSSPKKFHTENYLRAIYVYKGDVSLSNYIDDCPTVGANREYCDEVDSWESMQAIDCAFPDNWILKADYTLGVPRHLLFTTFGSSIGSVSAECLFPQHDENIPNGLQYYSYGNILNLILAAVTRRQDDGSELTSYSYYTYGLSYDNSCWVAGWPLGIGVLQQVFHNDTIQSLLASFDVDGVESSNFDNIYDLITSDPDTNVSIESKEGERDDVSLASLADLSFERFDYRDYDVDDYYFPLDYPGLLDQLLGADFIGAGVDNIRFADRACKAFSYNDARSGKQYAYRIYRFLVHDRIKEFFETGGMTWGSQVSDSHWNVYMFHDPFRIGPVGDEPPDGYPTDYYKLNKNDRFWVTVIDEIDLGLDSDEDDYEEYDPVDSNSNQKYGMISRRIIEMNPSGFILADRTWNYDSGDPELISQSGTAIRNKYNDHGRLIETYSLGYGTLTEEEAQTEGLIYVFDYEDKDGKTDNGEQIATGMKKGKAGTVYYVSAYEYNAIDPELLSKEVEYPFPVTEVSFTSGNVTKYNYDFLPSDDDGPGGMWQDLTFYDIDEDDDKPAVIFKEIIQPATVNSSATTFYPVERFMYDDAGNMILYGIGDLQNPEGFTQGDTFYVNYFVLDDEYRPLEEYFDYDTSTGVPIAGVDGFVRCVPDSDMLPPYHEVTEHGYDDMFGKVYTKYPDGRSDHWVYKIHSDRGGFTKWEYNDVFLDAAGVDNYRTDSLVKETVFRGSRIESMKQHVVTQADTTPSGCNPNDPDYQYCSESFEAYSAADIEFDDKGRPVSMTVTDGSDTPASSVSAKISYNGYGQIERSESPDGTIIRYVYDDLGRLQRTYRGTNDEHIFWRNTIPCDEYFEGDPFTPDDCLAIYDDNLVLTEKRFYGTGVNDAGELIQVRQYNTKPTNQYFFMADPDGDEIFEPYPAANNEDTTGYVENLRYDWRMRHVWSEYIDDHGTVLHNVLTWYNNADTLVLTATYGPTVPATIDPTLAAPSFPASEAAVDTLIANLFAQSPAPISVTRNIYNARGLMAESLQSWKNDDGEVKTSSSRTFYDYSDRPVEILSDNGFVQRYVYDVKNHQILSTTGMNLSTGYLELSRTIKEYLPNTDLISTATHYERKDGTTGDLGDSFPDSDSVVTWTYNWYDDSGRMIATADFGTNNTDFTNNTTPSSYDASADVVTLTDGFITSCGDDVAYPNAQFTCFAYDEAGRQTQVMDPADRLSYTETDHQGRTLLSVQNYNTNSEPMNISAYRYMIDTGQLYQIAAVDPEHFGSNPITSGNINWDATDGTLQITEYGYKATVMHEEVRGAGYDAISKNNSLIASVHLPNPVTGQASNQSSVEFAYDLHDRVVQRKDARGVSLWYGYDTQSNLLEIDIDLSGESPLVNEYYDVDSSVAAYQYDYTDSNLLETATTWTPTGTSEPEEINESSFTYSLDDLLLTASQTLGGQSGSLRTISYSWETVTESNHRRLDGVTYPTGTGLALTYGYGVANAVDDLDHRMDRLTAIEKVGPPNTTLASWSYLPGGRYKGHALGNAIGFSYSDGSDLVTLDRFGRVTDRNYTLNGSTVLRYEYGYTLSGNREFKRLTGHPSGNDHSWRFAYDKLDRLIGATEGVLNSSGNLISTEPLMHEWYLDALGNLSGGDSQISYRCFTDDNEDGQWNDADDTLFETDHHDTRSDNSIARRFLDNDGDGTAAEVAFVFDAAGNLLYNGKFFFRYDAFNRVTAIYEADGLYVGTEQTVTSQCDPGDKACLDAEELCDVGELCGEPGAWLYAYEYDALGRRVKTTEYPGAAAEKVIRHVYGSGAETLVEYEITDDGSLSGTFAETLLRYFVWGESFPDPLILGDFTGVGSGGGPTTIAELYYYIKDELGSTNLLTDANGVIVEGYLYSPYGETAIMNASGVPINESAYGNPFCFTGQKFEHQTGLYHFWARTYSPELQRWGQKDALGVLGYGGGEPAGTDGEAPYVSTAFGSAGSEYGDGLNLYLYVMARPTMMTDPHGRFSLPEIGAVNGLGMDLEGNTMDTGFGVLGAIAGYTMMIGQRNMMLESMVGISTQMGSNDDILGGIDTMLLCYNTYQKVQLARFGAGVISAGAKFARGILKAARKAGESIWDALKNFGKSRGSRKWTSWANYEKIVIGGKQYAKIGDRLYTQHAVDRMQPSGLGAPAGATSAGRSIAPEFVEEVIRTGTTKTVYVNGVKRTIHTSGTVQVITEKMGRIVITINPFSGG